MSADRPRVLVTGAGGFIGGRVVEALLELDRFEVVPALRRWSTAARIGRYPIDPVQCDLMEPDQIADAVAGIDWIIHCAVGSPEVTIEGTRNLLAAAVEAGVARVVHLSTIDVYGRAEGTITEETPHAVTGRAYGDSKIEAEAVCRDFAERGLEVVILRPTIVYGPFSDSWTIQFAERLAQGSWLLPKEACAGTCNLVHVDDLVRGILLALQTDGISGRAYNINGPERPTWQAYVEALNQALGLPDLRPPPAASAKSKTRLVEPVRRLVKAAFYRFEKPVVAVYQRSRLARGVMKWTQSTLRKVPSPAEYDLYGRAVDVSTERAEAELRYRPRVTMEAGVDLSAKWLRHEGVVRPRA
ncbi:MAG: NAD-dependent epimerase/dehydratase family protein [Gemmatimonadales bacterium]|nr:MAG: NAD-dependent epimerase/dehydratase family protein [Gemmatimonadales bacterium]